MHLPHRCEEGAPHTWHNPVFPAAVPFWGDRASSKTCLASSLGVNDCSAASRTVLPIQSETRGLAPFSNRYFTVSARLYMTASVSAVSFCAFRMSTGQPLSKSIFTTSSCPLNAAQCRGNQPSSLQGALGSSPDSMICFIFSTSFFSLAL